MLLPLPSIPLVQDVAKVEGLHGQLRVELVGADDVVIAKRALDGSGSCSELARLAAIVIASWESDVHPEFVRPQPPPAARPAAAPAAYDIALGVSLEQADKLAVGGAIGASWFPRGLGPGLDLLFAGETTRTLDLGEHQARWRRWTSSLQLAWRWGRPGLVVDAHGGLTLGWLTTKGVDFTENESNSSVSLAGTLGIRSSWWFSRHAAVWLDLRGLYFTRRESVFSPGPTGGKAQVPRWGGIASIGVALGRAPHFR